MTQLIPYPVFPPFCREAYSIAGDPSTISQHSLRLPRSVSEVYPKGCFQNVSLSPLILYTSSPCIFSWRAMLHFLVTDEINFSSPDFANGAEAIPMKRGVATESDFSCSPKSMYRLAHKVCASTSFCTSMNADSRNQCSLNSRAFKSGPFVIYAAISMKKTL